MFSNARWSYADVDRLLDQDTEAVVRLERVVKRFGKNLALDQVDLELGPGVTGLLGPNGSGKSTLIKVLLGLLRADSGTGAVLGEPWPQRSRQARDRIGYLPEDDCYLLGLQGIESAQLMARLSGLPACEGLRRAHEVLDYCDIGQERYRLVETYSTGMRQKLKFAQALLHDPELVILDEPTTGLDPTQREEFLGRIASLARHYGKTVLISTHILQDVKQICDRVVILVGGRVRLADTLERLQRPTEPGVQVQLFGPAEPLATYLRSEGWQVELAGARRLKVIGITQKQTGVLWRAARQVGVVIGSLQPAVNSLEQSFMQAVQGETHADS
jgi:ABC-2 type transport system ATP-binding protein